MLLYLHTDKLVMLTQMKNYTTGLIFFIFLLVSCESGGGEVGGETGSDTPVLKVLGPSVLTET